MSRSDRSDVRHFLVTKRDGKLSEITVFDNPDVAARAYRARESQLVIGKDFGYDVVLLGADRLSTCIATHGNWFDEPNRLEDALREDVKRYESDLRELADD